MKLSFWRQEPKTILKFLLAPIIINIIIEFCSRRSFLETISYIINSPLTFLYNSFIILTTL